MCTVSRRRFVFATCDDDGLLTLPPPPPRPRAFEPELLDNLRSIVDRTGARLILSSDWRRAPGTRAAVSRALATRGLRLEACTPEHGPPGAPHRPVEILAWIDEHNARCAAEHRDPTERVDAFVAVDDRPLARELAGEALVGRFVMTAPSAGLTAPARDAVVACLLAPQNVPNVFLDPRRRRAVGARVFFEPPGTVSLIASPKLKAFTLLRPLDDASPGSADVRRRGCVRGKSSRTSASPKKKRKDDARRAATTLRGSTSSDSGKDEEGARRETSADVSPDVSPDASQAWFPRTPTRDAFETTKTRSSANEKAASRRSATRGTECIQPSRSSSHTVLPPIRVSSASAGGMGSILGRGAMFLVGARRADGAHVVRYREGK